MANRGEPVKQQALLAHWLAALQTVPEIDSDLAGRQSSRRASQRQFGY